MKKDQKSEEQLKSEIFSVFSQCRNETSSDRRQVYSGQLCDLIFHWCNSYPFQNINTREIGLEIFKLVFQLVKENGRQNIPNDENEFFQYLKKSLYHARAEFHRTYESGSIKIPKEKMSKLKKIDEIVRMEESNLGRTLTSNECAQCISEWFNISLIEANRYLELKKMQNVIGLAYNSHSNDKVKDILESETVRIPYIKSIKNNLEDVFFSSINTFENSIFITDSIETVLNNTQERTRACYRALLTGFCIDNSIDLEGLSSVLDTEILDEYRKNFKIPSQHEIYLKYHPNVKKESAGVRASEMLKKILYDLHIILKERNIHNHS